MRVKHLVTTRMAGSKRGASKGKEKEYKAATTAGENQVSAPKLMSRPLLTRVFSRAKKSSNGTLPLGTKGHMKELMRLFYFNTCQAGISPPDF
jgi:hypothetical protein